MYGTLDISTAGLVAQRTRLNVVSGNLANRETILNADGEYDPYRRRFAVLAAGDADGDGPGVHVARIEVDRDALIARLEPDSPYADADGYVEYPDISPVIEMMNAMEAARSYEANIAAIEATKSMMSVALEMIV